MNWIIQFNNLLNVWSPILYENITVPCFNLAFSTNHLFQAVMRESWSRFFTIFISVLISFAFSLLTYEIFLRPFIRLLCWFSYLVYLLGLPILVGVVLAKLL